MRVRQLGSRDGPRATTKRERRQRAEIPEPLLLLLLLERAHLLRSLLKARPSAAKPTYASSSTVSRRMYVSIAAEKAAKPMPPSTMARGPLLRARTAPEMRPA